MYVGNHETNVRVIWMSTCNVKSHTNLKEFGVMKIKCTTERRLAILSATDSINYVRIVDKI